MKDKIYKALYESDLKNEGYSDKDLRYAVKQGWISKSMIIIETGAIRIIYLWLEDEMPQRKWLKRQLDKIKKFFAGDYSKYY